MENQPNEIGETREEMIVNQMEEMRIGLDDKFRFKCRACGKCCKNRKDVMLTSRDLFNIAKSLNLSTSEVIRRYCEMYIGHSSRIPIVKLKPVGPDQACPLLQDKRCRVHSAKPVVCALFPLGRVFVPEHQENGQAVAAETVYIFQGAECGSTNRQQTVRRWLEKFGLPVEDEFYLGWNKMLMDLFSYVNRAEEGLEQKQISPEFMYMIWDIISNYLYGEYLTGMEFLPQFDRNIQRLKETLDMVEQKLQEQLQQGGGEANGATA